ncbi:glycosyltransferase family 2 protein [Candidatus Stoquefichus massiliensis]|uniref:glycosyltransferase family 2 protein n=1 Tax=Candidatus Stoquefichus massiliensis TaxID=1470350 RepID=UPI0004BAD96D|nr:glycosyltransferase family A protein [Candidatus Stoquefichus massiliensis]
MSDLVSVIIPTYKNIDKICDAIESVINQTYKNVEIIVVDDNIPNSDYRKNTEKKLKEYIESGKIVYIQNEKNKERSFTRNNGVKHSHGDYIMFLDNDDVFFENKIESQLLCMKKKGKEFGVCYSNYIRKKEGKLKWVCKEKREGNMFFEVLARNLPIHPGSNLMIKREFFEQVGGFNENMFIHEDIDLLVRLMRICKIVYCDTLGLQVNLHDYPNTFDYYNTTSNYVRCEKYYIEQLSSEEKSKFRTLIGLQLVRFYIVRDPFFAIKIIFDYHISFINLVHYFFYAFNRYLRKSAYGFNI